MQTIIAHVESEFLFEQLHQFSVNSDFGHLIRVDKTKTPLGPGGQQWWCLPPPSVTLSDGSITRGSPPPGALQTGNWAFPYAVAWLIVNPLSPDWSKLKISGDNAPGFEDCLTKLMAEVRRFSIEASRPAAAGGNGAGRKPATEQEIRAKLRLLDLTENLRSDYGTLEQAVGQAYGELTEKERSLIPVLPAWPTVRGWRKYRS